jgi:hypothetical protein
MSTLTGVKIRELTRLRNSASGNPRWMVTLSDGHSMPIKPDADANFVLTGSGGIVEVQGTAETVPFSQEGFDQLMALARHGIAQLISLQKLTVT